MTVATQTEIVPAGTYTVDTLHSNANFEIEHGGLSVFRGGFKPIDAKLVSAENGVVLEGGVSVASVSIDDENLRPHLLSPDFFDEERNPDVSFRASEVTGSAEDLHVAGELTMAGVSLPVEATGRLRGPVPAPDGGEKLALSLETTIDRTAYGMDWQMELPDGKPILGNEVKLVVDLEFSREG